MTVLHDTCCMVWYCVKDYSEQLRVLGRLYTLADTSACEAHGPCGLCCSGPIDGMLKRKANHLSRLSTFAFA